MEKFIERARHIEIQVMADRHGNVVHLGERECSTQRRHQKLIEEAPSPAVDAGHAPAMGECAVSLTRNANYCGAGTIEFVVDQRDNKYYLPGDEHPHPGRAPGDGDDHRLRPGGRADPRRRRPAAVVHARPT